MIKAVIFDMDGVLIDSEPYWRQAEKEIFTQVDIKLTDQMCASTMGFRLDEVVQHWYDRYPWGESPTKSDIEEQVVNRVIELIIEKAEAMEGVYEALDLFKSKGLPIALASSSSSRIIETVIRKLNIRDYFEVIRSAENEEFGKPHPSIFIKTARDLGMEPTDCLVIEDSFNGLLAAMSARMKTVVIPESVHENMSKFDIADFRLDSLKDINAIFEAWQRS